MDPHLRSRPQSMTISLVLPASHVLSVEAQTSGLEGELRCLRKPRTRRPAQSGCGPEGPSAQAQASPGENAESAKTKSTSAQTRVLRVTPRTLVAGPGLSGGCVPVLGLLCVVADQGRRWLLAAFLVCRPRGGGGVRRVMYSDTCVARRRSLVRCSHCSLLLLARCSLGRSSACVFVERFCAVPCVCRASLGPGGDWGPP